MVYMLWMIRDMNNKFDDSVQVAMEYYQKKYGRVPNIVEYSKSVQPSPVLEDVAFTPISIPSNILLIGVKQDEGKIKTT